MEKGIWRWRNEYEGGERSMKDWNDVLALSRGELSDPSCWNGCRAPITENTGKFSMKLCLVLSPTSSSHRIPGTVESLPGKQRTTGRMGCVTHKNLKDNSPEWAFQYEINSATFYSSSIRIRSDAQKIQWNLIPCGIISCGNNSLWLPLPLPNTLQNKIKTWPGQNSRCCSVCRRAWEFWCERNLPRRCSEICSSHTSLCISTKERQRCKTDHISINRKSIQTGKT